MTGISDDGEVIAIGGLLPVWNGRCLLHMIVSENIHHQWIVIYRIAKWLINKGLEDYHRVEALSTFEESDRWLAMLGFQYEGILHSVMPNGQDAKSYSITR